jgi:phospho-N-acetylmuramoyl-pentapeptide-transferase
MLYHLFEYLKNNYDFPGAGLMHYISFRSMFASMIAIIVTIWIGKYIIKRLQKNQIGEEIRDLGLEGQLSKKGTPTMGGIIILIAILVPTILFCDLTNIYVLLLIITTLWLGCIGFLDDYIKVFKKNKEGLNGKYKIIGQVSLGLLVGLTLCLNDQVVIKDKVAPTTEELSQIEMNSEKSYNPIHKSTITTIPFFKGNEFDYKWLAVGNGKVKDIMGWVIYIVVIIFVITAVSNGTNLTDGMDGLAAGVSAIVGASLGILAYLSGNVIYSNYLNIMYIPNVGEVVIFIAALIGALLGFLWYNSYPAQVFMGDTGSLALGGIIAVAAIVIRKELLIPILCGIFFVESLSVIIQRVYFKYTKKKYGEGRRVFKMSPLHHHYQKEGIPALIKSPRKALPEAKIVMRFWLVAILLAVVTIVTLKIR